MNIDRRALLIGGAAIGTGVLIGVAGERAGWWEIDLLGLDEPDAALRRVLRASEAAQITAYDAALASPAVTPALTERLASPRQHHLDHLAALGGGQDDLDQAVGPGAENPDELRAAPVLPALPADPDRWPAYFAALEMDHSDLVGTGVRISEDRELARTLVLNLASEIGHSAEWANG